MRAQGYLAGSLIAAAIVIWHAIVTREQFFPAMVHLSSSKLSVAILGNLGLAVSFVVYKTLTWVFLGRLRDFEIERINERLGQAVIETLLAMTIFRQEFTVSFLAQFTILSLIKIFHWIAQDRVDYIETTPNISRTQHLRLFAFLHFLLGADYLALHHALQRTISHGVSVHLLFAFEYAVQLSTAAATILKYAFSVVDTRLQGRWEGKGVAVFYLELTLDLLHLITYSIFFAVVFSTYGIPIHLVRDLYWTFRNFQTRVRDFLRYRRIAANMERRFPDATPEDLQRADHVCIVCREEMAPGCRAKKLDCSHVFHLHCLRSWLERQQNCPICRAPVLAMSGARGASGVDGGVPMNDNNRAGDDAGDNNARNAGNGNVGPGGLHHNNGAMGNENNNNMNAVPEGAQGGVFIQQQRPGMRPDEVQHPQHQPTGAPMQQQQGGNSGIEGQSFSPMSGTVHQLHPHGEMYVQVVHIPVMVPVLASPHAMHAINTMSSLSTPQLHTPGSTSAVPTPEQHAIASQVAAAAAYAAVSSASPMSPVNMAEQAVPGMFAFSSPLLHQQQPILGMVPFGSPVQSAGLEQMDSQQQQQQQPEKQEQAGGQQASGSGNSNNSITTNIDNNAEEDRSLDDMHARNQALSTRFEEEEQQPADGSETNDLRRRRLQRFEQQQRQVN